MNSGRKRYIPDNVFWDNLREQWAAALRTMVEERRLIRALDLQVCRDLTDAELLLAEKEGRIFSLADAHDAKYYPAFFCDAEHFQAAELVSHRLGAVSGFDRWIFFSNTSYRLGGRTPLEALRDGELNLVLQAAEYTASKRRPHGLPRPYCTAV